MSPLCVIHHLQLGQLIRHMSPVWHSADQGYNSDVPTVYWPHRPAVNGCVWFVDRSKEDEEERGSRLRFAVVDDVILTTSTCARVAEWALQSMVERPSLPCVPDLHPPGLLKRSMPRSRVPVLLLRCHGSGMKTHVSATFPRSTSQRKDVLLA